MAQIHRLSPGGKSKPGGKCPICSLKIVREHAPFCSQHCADVDLGRWLGGRYRIPTEDAPGSDAPADPEPAGEED